MGLQYRPTELQQTGSMGSISYDKQNVNIFGKSCTDVIRMMYLRLRSEMMLCHFVPQWCDVCPHVPKAHIISEATSSPKATSFARQGKHHSKKTPFVGRQKTFFLLVEAAGFEPASERPSSQLSTSVVPCLLSLCPAGRNTLRSKPAPLLWRVTEPCARSRSLLHDATHRAAVLPGMTAAAIKQRLKLSYYCQLLFKSGAFIEAPRLCSLIMPRIPRRNPFAPI